MKASPEMHQILGDFLTRCADKSLSAEDVFGKPWEDLTEEQRRALKAINVGIMYGAPDWLIDGIKSGRFAKA